MLKIAIIRFPFHANEKAHFSYIRICAIPQKTATHRESGANKLMRFLWMALYESLQLLSLQRREALALLKKEGLYPFRRPANCTLTRSYTTDCTDIVGKVFDRIYMNLHRPWGLPLWDFF